MTDDTGSTVAIGSAEVAARFTLNTAIFLAIAGDPRVDAAETFAALSLMWALLCAFAGLVRRERPFKTQLTFWHEAAAYSVLFGLTIAADRAGII